MAFPNYQDKYLSKSLFSPEDSEHYRQRTGHNFFSEPLDGVILCYSRKLVKHIIATYPNECLDSFYGSNLYIIENNGKKTGVAANFGFGAPIVVTIVEQLISYGIDKFVNLGIAGTLQKNVDIGDIVVCDKAIRDEGTSHHYVKTEKYAYASPVMTLGIQKALQKKDIPYHTGASWTIDAPYCETADEVKQYQSEGVMTVEMEASALFAVAEYRGVQMGSIFTISDSLAHDEWKPEFDSEKTFRGLCTIFEVSRDLLHAVP